MNLSAHEMPRMVPLVSAMDVDNFTIHNSAIICKIIKIIYHVNEKGSPLLLLPLLAPLNLVGLVWIPCQFPSSVGSPFFAGRVTFEIRTAQFPPPCKRDFNLFYFDFHISEAKDY